jgi:heparan-sulfate lyase
VENQSYPTLAHRRTIWFVNKQSADAAFFVFLDEALGEATGALELHFQFAPGPVCLDVATGAVHTCFDDANVLVQPADSQTVTASLSRGWYAWDHGRRAARAAVAYRHANPAPAAFLTVVVPYRGSRAPDVRARLTPDTTPGALRVELSVHLGGSEWRLGRDLASGQGWVTAQTGSTWTDG